MSRERVAWIVSILLLALLAFQLPGTLAQRDDDAAWVRTLVKIHRLVDENYVDPVNDDDLKSKAINGMLGSLDPYTQYIPPAKQSDFERIVEGKFTGVGISLDGRSKRVVVISPIEGGPADKAGIHAGDLITKVNGQSIEGLAIDEVSKRIVGPVGTDVTLTVERGETILDFTVKRQEIHLPTVLGYDRNPDDSWKYFVNDSPKVAYIRLTQFDEDTYDDLKKVLAGNGGLVSQGMQGLILDLRFNGGGRLDIAENILDMFLKEGQVIVRTQGRNRPEKIVRANADGKLPDFPMIVLVNDDSASASEIVTGCLKDNHRAEIIGQRTFGKGCVQEVIPMDGGDGQLKLTVEYYYLPSGRLVQKKPGATDWGVEPQLIVPMEEAAENALSEAMDMRNVIRRTPTTQAETRPTTQPADPQFDAALSTMIGKISLQKSSTKL